MSAEERNGMKGGTDKVKPQENETDKRKSKA